MNEEKAREMGIKALVTKPSYDKTWLRPFARFWMAARRNQFKHLAFKLVFNFFFQDFFVYLPGCRERNLFDKFKSCGVKNL